MAKIKSKSLTKKEQQIYRSLGQFCQAQQSAVLVPRAAPLDLEVLMRDFMSWHANMSAVNQQFYGFRQEFQPDIINLLVMKEVKGFVEIGCGGGKTEIFIYAALLASWVSDKPIIFVAPRLDLLAQTWNRFKVVVRILNEFLEFRGGRGIEIRGRNVSSSGAFKKDEDSDAQQAEDELLQTFEVDTLSNSEEVQEFLEDAGAGDVILVCNDSFDKVTAALRKLPNTRLLTVLDEFHEWQTGEAKVAAKTVNLLGVLQNHSSDVWAFSATPKIAAEKVFSDLAIESGFWGVNVVWHALKEKHGEMHTMYSINAAWLRQWGYLKKHMKFAWCESNLEQQIPSEIATWLRHNFGTDKFEKCIREIAEWIATAKYMTPGHVALVFASAVPFIRAFMSDECKTFREDLEKELGVKFHASHADIKSEIRNATKEQIKDDETPVKHIILSHSTWLMGVDLPKISYILLQRELTTYNLVQAVSRGTRAHESSDTCTVILFEAPGSEQTKKFIKTMYGITGGDVEHVMLNFNSELVGTEIVDDDLKPFGSDELEIELSQAYAEIVEDIEEDEELMDMRKKIATGQADVADNFVR